MEDKNQLVEKMNELKIMIFNLIDSLNKEMERDKIRWMKKNKSERNNNKYN